MVVLWLALLLADGWQAVEGWEMTPFARGGKARFEKGVLTLEAGAPMSGMTRKGAFAKTNYEIRWEARRVKGGDFFASLTFPVGESHATFVTGGWGGDIVGVSSIDGWDAAENETRRYVEFEEGKWYAMRVEVRAERIRAWIGEEKVVDVGLQGGEWICGGGDWLSMPLGFASYNTASEIRGVEWRELKGR